MQDHRWPASTWTVPLAFALLYALWPALGLPRFFYAPQTREVFWHRPEDVVLMGWYGRLTMAAVAAAVVGGAVARLIDRRPAPWQRLGPWIAAGGVLFALIAAAVSEITRWIL